MCLCVHLCVAVQAKKSKTTIESSLEVIQQYFARAAPSSETESDDVVLGKRIATELAKLPDDDDKHSLKRKMFSDVLDAVCKKNKPIGMQQQQQPTNVQYLMVGTDGVVHPIELRPLNES